MINTVLFDFDGTLVNTNDVIVASWQHTYMHYQGREESLEKITACFGEPLLGKGVPGSLPGGVS